MNKLVRYKSIFNEVSYINVDYIIDVFKTMQPHQKEHRKPILTEDGQKFEYGMTVTAYDRYIPLTEECFNRICSVMGIAEEVREN